MKKQYNQPEVQVTEIISMSVMQVVSADGDSFNMFDATTDDQW